MLQIDRSDVVDAPFPHVVKDQILPAEIFAGLKADFPSYDLFKDQNASSGSQGSRVGAGTGFDIYRGDVAYDTLIGNSAAWKEFDRYINSSEFVSLFLDTFGPDLNRLGCSININPARYDRGFIEPRDVLTAKPTFRDRIRSAVPRLSFRRGSPNLFTRLDIEKSTKGYAKPPHCDRENRLCSLIIYFTDMEREGVEGGELNIYKHRVSKEPHDHERHPKASDVVTVATLKPRSNLGVFFPCSNNSYHGVNAVTTPGKERDFLYINVSSVDHSCW